jgi:hypothetical protein
MPMVNEWRTLRAVAEGGLAAGRGKNTIGTERNFEAGEKAKAV